MSDILPFLATLAPSTGVRSFASAVPRVDVPAGGASPWAPPPPPVVEPEEPPIDFAALRDEALEQGRAEGLRETAALREQLARLVSALADAETLASTMRANLIADAAATVVDAWLGASGSADKLLPVIRAWEARSSDPAKAHVHPSEVEALREAIGETDLEIVADASLAPGTLKLRSAAHELTHDWQGRLSELRDAIAHALEVKS